MPVEVKVHTVSHFIAPINGKVDLWGPECGGIFTLDYSLVKMGHSLHKPHLVPFVSLSSVLIQSAWSCDYLYLDKDWWSLDYQLVSKVSKHHFFRDIYFKSLLVGNSNWSKTTQEFQKQRLLTAFQVSISFGWKFKISVPKDTNIL